MRHTRPTIQRGQRPGTALLLACALLPALAQSPSPPSVSGQEALDLFSQRERARSQEVWLRGYAQPPAAAPFGLHSLDQQLWYRDWRLRQQMDALAPDQPPYCQPPYYIARPPFRQCPPPARR
jgi:hypothetical protein